MKKVKLLLLAFLFLPFCVNANVNLNIDVKEDNVIINKPFNFNLNINFTSTWEIQLVDIKWLERFKKIWQSSSTSTKIINGEREDSYILSYTLFPEFVWDFVLWPAIIKVEDQIIQSNTLSLNVWEKQEEKNIISQTDDIKPIKYLDNILSYFDFFIPLLIFILWILFYFFTREKKEVSTEVKKETLINKKKLLLINLDNLKLSLNNEKSLFYWELNLYFREYFCLLWINQAHFLTLKELKKENIKQELLNLFIKSYYNEFNDKEDEEENRLKLIDDFIKIINN